MKKMEKERGVEGCSKQFPQVSGKVFRQRQVSMSSTNLREGYVEQSLLQARRTDANVVPFVITTWTTHAMPRCHAPRAGPGSFLRGANDSVLRSDYGDPSEGRQQHWMARALRSCAAMSDVQCHCVDRATFLSLSSSPPSPISSEAQLQKFAAVKVLMTWDPLISTSHKHVLHIIPDEVLRITT